MQAKTQRPFKKKTATKAAINEEFVELISPAEVVIDSNCMEVIIKLSIFEIQPHKASTNRSGWTQASTGMHICK